MNFPIVSYMHVQKKRIATQNNPKKSTIFFFLRFLVFHFILSTMNLFTKTCISGKARFLFLTHFTRIKRRSCLEARWGTLNKETITLENRHVVCNYLSIFPRNKLGNFSVQSRILLCIQLLDKENKAKRPLGLPLFCTIVWDWVGKSFLELFVSPKGGYTIQKWKFRRKKKKYIEMG